MSIYVDSEETADGALSLTASRQNILWAEMAMESNPQIQMLILISDSDFDQGLRIIGKSRRFEE